MSEGKVIQGCTHLLLWEWILFQPWGFIKNWFKVDFNTRLIKTLTKMKMALRLHYGRINWKEDCKNSTYQETISFYKKENKSFTNRRKQYQNFQSQDYQYDKLKLNKSCDRYRQRKVKCNDDMIVQLKKSIVNVILNKKSFPEHFRNMWLAYSNTEQFWHQDNGTPLFETEIISNLKTIK